MNAVLADPAAGHDDHIAGFDFLAVRRLAIEFCGHDAGGAAVNQRFA